MIKVQCSNDQGVVIKENTPAILKISLKPSVDFKISVEINYTLMLIAIIICNAFCVLLRTLIIAMFRAIIMR